jgi:hypothetical protein
VRHAIWTSEQGLSLVDAVAASAVLACGVLSLAQVFVSATASNAVSRRTTYAVVLAAQKLEELRGTELTPSPPSTLNEDTAGYVDYIDRFGARIASSGDPPPEAAFTRRWSILPLPADPVHIQVIQVRVVTAEVDDARRRAGRLPGEARLVTVRARTST